MNNIENDNSISINFLDDLFTIKKNNNAEIVVNNQSNSRKGVISYIEYKDWFDKNKSDYNLMFQFNVSCTLEMCETIPDYIYDFCERIPYAISSRHHLSSSDVHISSSTSPFYTLIIRFWISFNEITAFLNLMCMIKKFHNGLLDITKEDVYNKSMYGASVSMFRYDGYERSLNNSGFDRERLTGVMMTDIWQLKHNPIFNIGHEIETIKEICRELILKDIFLVRSNWTFTWQTLHYFWLRMRKHPQRNLPDDWYEKTRDELLLTGENV